MLQVRAFHSPHLLNLFAVYYVALVATPVYAATYVPGKAFDRFVTIWLENEDFAPITENADYQYLSKQGILLTSYYALTHPSQPNYVASVGGDYFGLDNDNEAQIPENVATIADLLDSKGITWKEYMESIPSPGFTGVATTNASGHNAYARKHNPLVSFASVSNNHSRSQNIVSFDQFEHDLASQSLPQWMHMSPNMSSDGHDTGLAYGVAWSRSFLTPLLSDQYFTNRTLILLTLDESATYTEPNKIASLLLGDIPSNLKSSTDGTFYTHYSILSTLENNFELPNLGRYDVGANVFQIVANTTGYGNQAVVDAKMVHLNQSYPGYLNSQKNISIPTPNVELVGGGGRGVLGSISNAWLNGTYCTDFLTPYNGSGLVFDSISPPVYSAVAIDSTITASASACAASASATSQSGASTVLKKQARLLLMSVALSLIWALI